MQVRILFCLTLMCVVTLFNDAYAQSDDRDSILAVMEKAFATVHSNNADDWRAIQLAEGTSLSFRPDPEGLAEKLQMSIRSNEEFLANLKPDGHEYVERWTGEPALFRRRAIL